ncbi:hypothetical protein [Leptospira alexanderi]|uniref:hypothetical protein n=1 Tax=Leptospira alexanderi TaxID=100053 RepID=UPI000990ABA5|nr:hypothetical protein [Leptospira alexanderi]
MITPSSLFAPSKITESEIHLCYYCGASCNDAYTKKDYVKDTFSNRDIIFHPGSDFVCHGCIASFSESTDIELIDGEERSSQRIRQYSWILTTKNKICVTKKHLKEIRNMVLNPPDPPFAIILAESGQKHLIFRSKVAYSKNYFPVSLEDEIIFVNPTELKNRLDLIKKLIVVTGKPALADKYSDTSFYINIFKEYGEQANILLTDFFKIRDESLTRLALWIAPNKEDCKNE